MDTQNTAQGLASLGRNGDSMLVHMSPHEVAGLNYLAKKQGGSLTINPETGMPEAFSLGGVFKSLLPMAAGWALGPGGFGMFDSALTTGLAVGAATGALTGNLGQGIMAGFGAYGGADLGNMFKTLGTKAPITPEAVTNMQGAVANPSGSIGATSMTNGYDAATGFGNFGKPDMSMVNPNLQTTSIAPNFSAANYGGAANPLTGSSMQGVQNLFGSNNPAFTTAAGKVVPAGSGWEQFTNPAVGGSAWKLGAPVGAAVLGGLEPSDLQPKTNLSAAEQKVYEQTGVDAQGKPVYGYVAPSAYNPYRSLYLGGPNPLQLPASVTAKEGGAINSYAMGGTVTTGGLRDLYGSTDNLNNPQLSRDGYGIGRLDGLARQQAMTQAQTTGYAKGGYLDGPGDGMSDSIPATIEGKQPARLADGEFVVPADVVSHLGNGSTKAGSKRLYSMLDKVRKARTGHTKQGKQIHAEKYLPV